MKAFLPILLLSACAPVAADTTAAQSVAAHAAQIEALEARTGGRYGVVLLDDEGRTLLSHRADERFAMCSTFKVALAAAVFQKYQDAPAGLTRDIVPYKRSDLPFHSPGLLDAMGDADEAGTSLSVAAKFAVMLSDNGAANILIDELGGPAAVTQAWRAWGDTTSRLDRKETALNENAAGDPRDTSTPAAMARTMRAVMGEGKAGDEAKSFLLITTENAQTGLDRVRAGLPEGWRAGDKTGTCTMKPTDEGAEYNDVGWVRAPDGRMGWFAVMLDRPGVDNDTIKAVQADTGRLIAEALQR